MKKSLVYIEFTLTATVTFLMAGTEEKSRYNLTK